MPEKRFLMISGTTLDIILKTMARIPFAFFARVVLMTASFVLAIFSLTTHVTGKEFVYAAGSIAAVMIGSLLRRKRRFNRHQPRIQ